jgi:hypothetical protein
MKSILVYGQAINAKNRGKADGLAVFQSGIEAVRDGYNVKAFERVTSCTGFVIIRKRKEV